MPGELQYINVQEETDSGDYGDAIFLAEVENRMVKGSDRKSVRKIAKMYIRKGPWEEMPTPASCTGPGEERCSYNAYVHVEEQYIGRPSSDKAWRPRLKVNPSGSRDWLGRRRVDLSFKVKGRRYYLHRVCGFAWGRGAAYANVTWASFYPRDMPAAGHLLEVDHVDGDCYRVDAEQCTQHRRHRMASTAESFGMARFGSCDWRHGCVISAFLKYSLKIFAAIRRSKGTFA